MSDSVGQYLTEISRYPLLTKQQEILLARQVKDWYDNPEATPRQKRLGKRAYEKLINCNLRLVVNIAKRYTSRAKRTDLLDIIQEGNAGLAYGIKKFDPERGYALSTYIYWWIRQGITRYLSTNDRMIRLPSGAWEILNKLRYWVPEFQRDNNRLPTVEECAAHCKTTVPRMHGYMAHVHDCSSVDMQLRGGDGDGASALIDLIADERSSPMEDLALNLGTESVSALMSFLSKDDQHMLVRYYGLDGDESSSLQAIGNLYGVSRERIRQRINRSLLKLRLRSAGIESKEAA